jgi:fumarate reductase flavoprotein subunit
MLQNNGTGIRMAQSAGGALYNVAVPEMAHAARVALFVPEERLSPVDYKALSNFVLRPDAMAVNPSGKRFANESQGMGIGEQSWKAGDFYYQIYSDAEMKKVKEQGFDKVDMLLNIQDFSIDIKAMASSSDAVSSATAQATPAKAPSADSSPKGDGPSPGVMKDVLMAHVPIANLENILAIGEEDGAVYKAATISELAARIGAPDLVNSVVAYEKHCAGVEVDPFKKDRANLVPLGSKGPYYAIKGKGRPYSTCGGLDVNTDMNVLDGAGKSIQGVYAAGTDTMGVLLSEKISYVDYGGVAHGWALTSGRLAGAKAAAFARGR